MRPVTRGVSPQEKDFNPYREAFGSLVGRIGYFCSYCERRIPTQLAVEHIQPKALPQYAALVGRWDNYLLGCVNCNGTKKDKNVDLEQVYLPDRDNTAYAFTYTEDGKVEPSDHLTEAQQQIARRTLEIPGLDKPVSEIMDENGKLVAVDRVSQRMEIWLTAFSSKDDLAENSTDTMRRQIVKTAMNSGFFSIWMAVFADDPAMRRLLIEGYEQDGVYYGFRGTAADCFDDDTELVSPRPNNGLTGGGKI